MKNYTRERLELELRELEIPEEKIQHALKKWDNASEKVNEYWKLDTIREIIISHPTNHEGEVKYCSSCDKIRKTTCCACGCGNCKTCGKRWICLPPMPDFTKNIINIPFVQSGELNTQWVVTTD